MSYLGLIEGFYGRRFKPASRESLLTFLQEHGLKFYIYAPKEERRLRQDLMSGSTAPMLSYINKIRQKCRELGLDFGLALSPYNLTARSAEITQDFKRIVQQYCDSVRPDLLCLLFDDQKVEGSRTAAAQRALVLDALEVLPDCVKRFIICPAYYSFDPILDKLFGARPDDYFKIFTADLPEKVEIFWTGNQVLSPDITPEDLARAAELLGRKPFIWDNYPVNDGKKSSRFLNLKPFNGRRDLDDCCSGHAVNPMLECELNKYVILSLVQKYQGLGDEAIAAAFKENLTVQLGKGAGILMPYLNLLTDKDLDQLNALHKAMLTAACDLERGNPALKDIKDFLNGEYAFDQACLT